MKKNMKKNLKKNLEKNLKKNLKKKKKDYMLCLDNMEEYANYYMVYLLRTDINDCNKIGKRLDE
jgi:hypothetical protein